MDHRMPAHFSHPRHLKFRNGKVYRIQLGPADFNLSGFCKWTLKKEWYGEYSWVFYTLFHSYLKRTNNKKDLSEQSWTRSHTSLNQSHSEFPGPSPLFIYIQYIYVQVIKYMYIFVQNTVRLFELDFFRPASSGREFSAEVTLWRPRPPSYGSSINNWGRQRIRCCKVENMEDIFSSLLGIY